MGRGLIIGEGHATFLVNQQFNSCHSCRAYRVHNYTETDLEYV